METKFLNLLLNIRLMPPDCRHAFLDLGFAKWELIVSNPGMFISWLLHVSVRNMKSIFEMALTKSLFFVLSPRILLVSPLIFHVLKLISENILFDI
jgi:hypothetical protein